WSTFLECITSFEALELAVKDKRQAWKAQKASMEQQVTGLKKQVEQLEKKRRLYSWQQAEGIITDQELLAAHRQLKSEEGLLTIQMDRLKAFKGEESPMTLATFKRLAEYWSGDIANELWDATDDVKARFAELFDLQATIVPDKSQNGYHINMSANVPLEMEGDALGAYDMVFSSSRGGLKGERITLPKG
ncbi:MAG: hypothetical protein V3R96_08470, partial [Dehalococcoidales bacterium]